MNNDTVMMSNTSRYRTLFQIAILVGLFIILIYPTGIMGKAYRNPIRLITYDTFLCSAFLGAFFIGLPKRKVFSYLRLTLPLAGIIFLFLMWVEPITDVVNWKSLYCRLGASLGLAAIGLMVYRSISHRIINIFPENGQTLYPAIILPLYVYESVYLLNLTISLHPLVYDPILYAVDQSFGFQASFVVGRYLFPFPMLKNTMVFIYISLPLFVGMVFWASNRNEQQIAYRPDGLMAFVLAGVFGYALYHVYPVVGPAYMFQSAFPFNTPDISTLVIKPLPAPLVHRNCMPSLHVAWALLCLLQARHSFLWIRGLAVIYVVCTIVAILAFGFHYAIDIIVAVPFVLAVHAASYLDIPFSGIRKQAIFWGTMWTFGWIATLKWASWILYSSISFWLLTMACIVHCAWLYHRLTLQLNLKLDVFLKPTEKNRWQTVPFRLSMHESMAIVFALSGFSGLVYEVVFAKKLSLIFGSTAMASATVLSVYMGGMALGSWIGGKLGEKSNDPILLYVGCELGIGFICFFSPSIFEAIQHGYISLTENIHPTSPIRLVYQYALGCIGLLPPTVLMGITLPVLVRVFGDRGETFGPVVSLLYGANTVGAAMGALVTGYILLPVLGVFHTNQLAVALNLLAALGGYRFWKSYKNDSRTLFPPATCESDTSNRKFEPHINELVTLGIILGFGGCLTFALETIYVHLLAIVAGNSAYAFSLMLFTFLLGLGSGAAMIRKLIQKNFPTTLLLIAFEIGLAASVLIGLFAWNELPAYFASFEFSPVVLGFGAREFIRGLVCFLVMVPSALFIGAIYPAAMELIGTFSGSSIRAMGKAAAINTLGNIAGAILGGFILIPFMGSYRALQSIAATAFLLGLLAWFVFEFRQKRTWMLGATALFVNLLLVLPNNFDLNRLSSGANVYFREQNYGEVIDHIESMDGGLTTVAQQWLPDGKRKLTLLTNGKFQGDDGSQHEMLAQTGFALCPLLHTTKRERALVIGYGVGVSARTIVDAAFRQVDLVDLSKDIIDMADKYFSHVNHQVTKRHHVSTYITDGRHFLLTNQHRYDLISMEITSIWFAGAGNLYNREFYKLIKSRLNQGGVFQQWIQLHHLYPSDIVTALTTLRCEFPHVWLYFVGSQGVLVATQDHLPWTDDAIQLLDNTTTLQEILSLHGGSVSHLQKTLLLNDEQIDQIFKEYEGCRFASTDDNLYLEYGTPKGNWRDYTRSTQENIAFLTTYRDSLSK